MTSRELEECSATTDEITLLIPGAAKSERKRQRFVKGVGTVGKRTDEPDRADWKAVVRLLCARLVPEPFAGPLRVHITVRKVVPPSWPKKPCGGNPWPWAWWKKPDAENLAKPVLDAMTGVAWFDDAQIVSLTVEKEFGHRDETKVVVTRVVESARRRELMARGHMISLDEARELEALRG